MQEILSKLSPPPVTLRNDMSNKIHVRRTKAYKVVCTKLEIPIDQEELQTVLDAVESGQPAVLKRGIFNPSYFVGVVEDEERVEAYYQDIRRNDSKAKVHGMKRLKDIYPDDSTLKAALAQREKKYIELNSGNSEVVHTPQLPPKNE